MFAHLHVGAESAGLEHDRQLGFGVDAELAVALGRIDEFDRLLDGELVGRKVFGNRGPVFTPLEVGAVTTDPGHDRDAVGVGAERDGVHRTGVDVAETLRHLLLETDDLVGTEVEVREPRDGLGFATRDGVEVGFHPSGEGVVDQIGEVLFEQRDDGEGLETRHEGRTLLPHVLTTLDGSHDRGVGRRTTDFEFFETFHQRGFGEAGRRLGVVACGLDVGDGRTVALVERREQLLGCFLVVFFVSIFSIDLQETLMLDDRATRGEDRVAAAFGFDTESEGDGLAGGIGHLRSDRALPDHLVDLEVLGGEFGGDLFGALEPITGGADGLVGLLGVLRLRGVGTGSVGDEVVAVPLDDLVAGSRDRGLGQRGAVGSHVGDEASLVETLCDSHGLGRGESELSPCFLLVGRGGERSGRATAIRLRFATADGRGAAGQFRGERAGRGLVEVGTIGLGQGAVLAEVTTGRHPKVIEFDQHGGERIGGVGGRIRPGRGIEGSLEIPVVRRPERHPLTLSSDDDAGGHRLHTPGGEPRHDLLPEHRRDLVTDESVEESACLLGIDHPTIELTGIVDGSLDRFGRDLVEDHALDRHSGAQHLEEMPGDGLSFAVLVGGEYEFARIFHQLLELADLLGLLGRHDVERFEPVVDVDAQAGPLLALVGGRNLGRVLRQIADVPDRGLDHVIVAEIPGDLLRFCW